MKIKLKQISPLLGLGPNYCLKYSPGYFILYKIMCGSQLEKIVTVQQLFVLNDQCAVLRYCPTLFHKCSVHQVWALNKYLPCFIRKMQLSCFLAKNIGLWGQYCAYTLSWLLGFCNFLKSLVSFLCGFLTIKEKRKKRDAFFSTQYYNSPF